MGKISVIIITFRRVILLEKCLNSILQSDDGPFEIIVGINGEDSETVEFLRKFPSIRVIQLKAMTPGEARNHCTQKVNGDILVFLDDDTVIPKEYFRMGRSIFFENNFDVLGGPDRTAPEATFLEKSLGITLTSPLATAMTRKRHGSDFKNKTIEGAESKLILCNLWMKACLFFKEEYCFCPLFYRNEENVLLFELRRDGKKIGYQSNLFVYHSRKANLIKLSKAVFSSGKYRIRSFFYYPRSCRMIYLFPAVTFIAFAISMVVSPRVALMLLGLYLTLSLLSTGLLFGRRKKHIKYFFFSYGYQIAINLFYALGSIYEVFHLLFLPVIRFKSFKALKK